MDNLFTVFGNRRRPKSTATTIGTDRATRNTLGEPPASIKVVIDAARSAVDKTM
jgi:hypothetical protein